MGLLGMVGWGKGTLQTGFLGYLLNLGTGW